MRAVWQRMEHLVATKRAAAVLVLFAFALYWIEALGWPFERGRDAWDYMTYYLSLFDTHTPFTEVMLFRTPVTPIALGLPLSIGGATALEVTMAVFFAISVLAWSLAALAYSRLAAVLVAGTLLVFPAFSIPFHEASSDAVAMFGFSLFALGLVRTAFRPSAARFVGLGAGAAAIALTRPAYVILAAGFLIPLCIRASWRSRFLWGVAYLCSVVALVGSWTLVNELRYGDLTLSRLSVAGQLPRVVPSAGPASVRLTAIVQRDVLSLPPYRRLHVTPAVYFDDPSEYEWIRLLGIADQADGIGSGFRLLKVAEAEAPPSKAHPVPTTERKGTYGHIATSMWHYVSLPAYRDQTHLKPAAWPVPAPTVSVSGHPRPNPEALLPSREAITFGFLPCASNEIARCILSDPSAAYSDPAQARRYREVTSTVRRWDAPLGTGQSNRWLAIQLYRVSHYFPPPWLWLVVAAVMLPLRRVRGSGALAALLGLGGLVLLLHAWVVGFVGPYAYPVLPAAIFAAICAAVGVRGERVTGEGGG